jgi:hypothetical protein
VGDWWTYQSKATTGVSEFTIKVVRDEKQADGSVLHVCETSMPNGMVFNEWYSKPSGWVVWHKEHFPKNNATVNFQPLRQLLKNPPGANDSWRWAGKGNFSVDIDETSTVAGAEEVVVPAGRFKAVKVVTNMTQGGTRVTKTYWYANWIGLVKAMTDTGSVQSTTELVDYSFRKRP